VSLVCEDMAESDNVAELIRSVGPTVVIAGLPLSRSAPPMAQLLDSEELTILTAWAEGVSEALAYAPEHLGALMSEAWPGAPWRAGLGLPEPSAPLEAAIDSLGRLLAAVAPGPAGSQFDAILRAARQDPPAEPASTAWRAACCWRCSKSAGPGSLLKRDAPAGRTQRAPATGALRPGSF
jgi:hypothetical protein